MGYVLLDNIVRSAIANKGHNTLHLYVPYLHWAFRGLEKFQREGVYTDIRYTKDFLDENNCLPFPSDMLMWNRIGMVNNGQVFVFINDQGISLDPEDQNSINSAAQGLFSYDSDSTDVLYSTNVYVASSQGIVQVDFSRGNTFRVDWVGRKFQVSRSLGEQRVYLEYVARAFNPSTQTMVNEVITDYLEKYIYFRESRFNNGSSHRETIAAEAEWMDERDEIREAFSDLTGEGLLAALTKGTRKSIDQ